MDREFKIVFTADTSAAMMGMQMLGAEFRSLEQYVNGAGTGLGGVTSAMNTLTLQANQASTAVHQTTGKMSKFFMTMTEVASFAVMEGIVQVFMDIGASAQTARDKVKELAEETMKLRDEMRELANLKNKESPDNEVAGEVLSLGVKAGMLPNEAREYLEQYEGSSPAGFQKGNITEKVKHDLSIEGAKFGQRVKIKPKTAGDLAGVLSQHSKIESVEQGAAQFGQIAYGLNEGRGNLEPLVRSLINTAGSVVGKGGAFESLPELAAVLGVASTHANPHEAGTRIRQSVRGLRDLSGESGDWLKKAKIKDGMKHLDRVAKIKPFLDEADRSGKGADTYLKEHGFKNDEEVRAIVQDARDLPIIQERIKNQSEKITGSAVITANYHYLTRSVTGQRKRQLATQAQQDFLRGEELETNLVAKENAELAMREAKEIGTWQSKATQITQDWLGLRTLFGGTPATEKWRMDKADERLYEEAKRIGIPEKEISKSFGIFDWKNAKKGVVNEATYDDWHSRRRWISDHDRLKQYNDLALKITRKGGDPTGGPVDLSAKIGHMVSEQKKTNEILLKRDIANGDVPDPGPQAPKASATRNTMVGMRNAATPKRP